MKRSIRKMLALVLALAMMLSCATAFAGTITVKVSADRDALKEILQKASVPEDRLPMIDSVLALVNALDVKIITADDGKEVNLALNGEDLLTLGWQKADKVITLVSSLIPNYVLTLNEEAMGSMMGSFAGGGEGGAGSGMSGFSGFGGFSGMSGMDMSGIQKAMEPYMGPFIQACTAAVTPGEPVQGEYQFDGYNFDVMIPVDVNVPAMAEAYKTMMDGMMSDEAVISYIKQFAQMFGASADGFDPEKVKASAQVAAEHFPEKVDVEVYSSTADSSTYVISKAFDKGKEEPSHTYTMLMKDGKSGVVTYIGHDIGVNVGVIFGDGGLRVECKQGEDNYILDFKREDGDPTVYHCDLYILNTDTPAISIDVTVSASGERTLPVEAGERTVLTLEDLMGGGEAATGLMSDLMTNGIGTALPKLMQAVPEAGSLITMMMTPRQTTEEAPAAPAGEQEPAADADPSAWKTLGDVLALNPGNNEATWNDEKYTYIFEYGGKWWMVNAAFSEELKNELAAVDVFEDDWQEKKNAILAPCEITEVVDLTAQAIPQEELDQWIGKTGKEMLDAGWEYDGYSSLREDEALLNMINGKFSYKVTFTGKIGVPANEGEMPNLDEAAVAGIQFSGISYHFSEPDEVPAE